MRATQTLLLTVSDVRELVQKVGLREIFLRLADRLESDFIRWPEFQKSARVGNHSADGVIELMPTSDNQRYSFKYVNGHPSNFGKNLPTVMGFGCLADFTTGYPLLISEMTVLTAIRTAATSALAAKALAVPVATTMALIGNGAQSEFQALAFFHILSINRIHLFDIAPEATERLMKNLRSITGLELVSHSSAQSAVEGVEIITTSTASKQRAVVLTPDMVVPGVHLNAIGGDCPGKTEIHPDILRKASVFVEFEPQTRIEGEIQQVEADFPVTELWQVLASQKPGRTRLDEITLFDSVGFSIEDYSILSLVYDLAFESGIGTVIDLVPPLTNVRDLYGALTEY